MAEGSEDQGDTTNMEHVESSQAGTDGTEDEEDTVGTESEDDEDDDEEEEEPKLKYARITSHLGPIYRNGDATSTFLVAGDKMFIGTHNGNIVRYEVSSIFRATTDSHAACTFPAIVYFPSCLSCTLRLSYKHFHLTVSASSCSTGS
ncbi:vacuolar assembly protein [Rutstroemia sp. NJR-2017a BBW]|nr:vacuolar assembly protein [Rutstroemia sp. NJR-2017a BBW]